MIINDFNIIGVTAFPCKTNAPLIIDTDAELPLSLTFKCFQLIARWLSKVL